MQRTSIQSGGLRGILPLKDVTVETPDISEYLGFGFYEHVSYKDNSGLGMTSIRRWLGVYPRVCGIMSYCILTQKGMVISRTTIQRLSSLEKETYKFKSNVSEFDTLISRRFIY